MSLKSDKLANRLQEIQQFVAARTAQNETFQVVEQELVKIADSLRQGKLTVQIVSHNPAPAQALQNFLSSYKPLPEFYNFQRMLLPREPEQAAPEPAAALILQVSSASTAGLQQTRYELPINHRVLIGRDDSQCQICLPNQYAWVSGRHAEIQSVSNSEVDSSHPTWQICNFNSTNGTYLNGQRLQDRQVLRSGDRITLGYENPTEKSPEFIFECQSHLDSDVSSKVDEFYRKLVDCDILCLVLEPNQMLTADEKQLIEKASISPISLLVVVVELPEPHHPVAQEIKTSIAEVKARLQNQNSSLSLELVPLRSPLADPDAKELDSFCKSLEKLVKRKPEDILIKRLTGQAVSQIALIEKFFNNQEKALETEIQQDEAKIRGGKGEDLQKKTDKSIRQLCDDKIELFKQAKAKLSQSRANLLDEYLSESLTSKISEAVDKLKSQVIKKEGCKYIELRAIVTKQVTERRGVKSSKPKEKIVDANTALIDLCRAELSQWANEEWERICTRYNQGGLKGLFQKNYQALSSIPALDLSYSALQPRQTIDLQEIFASSLKKPSCETRYQEVSPLFYLLKKVRSQWMQFMFMFSFLSVLGIAGGRRQIIQKLTQPIGGAFQNAPLISFLFLAGICYFLFKFLKRTYQNFKEAEQEKAVEKMRNELRSYYQSLVKNRLVEKISQKIIQALEVEEQRLDELIKTVKQLAEQFVTEAEGSQLPLKLRMSKRKEQQNNLRKELSELQKLKRI
ncbi:MULTISPECIES: FHA domain-containing protein [Cyanophyceae]|uniref:FHA domain-containing protein n=1 Tax=Cyanophyceae TaxID=3028117 RepID=UPI001688CE53|nr:FHA domain-containing protein [Trichocoleus sp. FACHB-69]MBD1935653.1 FHA domain-containing protein [Trichocoleus sp. FACHB-69]